MNKVKGIHRWKRYEKWPSVSRVCWPLTTSNGGWSMGVLPGWNCGDEITRWLSYIWTIQKIIRQPATFMLVRIRSSVFFPKPNHSSNTVRHTCKGIYQHMLNQMPFSYDVNLQRKKHHHFMRDVLYPHKIVYITATLLL